MFKSPLVVGYKGEIGSFILNGLLRVMPKALDIWCYDINETEEERIERIKKSDVIFLCVPMQDTLKWFDSYAYLLDEKTIIEQCSLKEFIPEEISERFPKRRFAVLSMHILFRPSATLNKEDRRIIVVDHPLWEWYEKLIKQITQTDNILHFASYGEHDAVMAYHQTLIHKTILILNKLLPLDQLPEKYISDKNNVATYISKRIKELSNRIIQGDKTLYTLIQNNRYAERAFKDFEKEWQKFDINNFKFEKETINEKEITF